jgi:hypothetical protein
MALNEVAFRNTVVERVGDTAPKYGAFLRDICHQQRGVGAQTIAESPQNRGLFRIRRDHVRVEVEHLAFVLRSTIPFPAHPGTAVLPICSIDKLGMFPAIIDATRPATSTARGFQSWQAAGPFW